MGTCRIRGRSPSALRAVLAAGILFAGLGGRLAGQQRTPVAPPGADVPAASPLAAASPDTFTHQRHEKVPCLGCHLSASGKLLKFEPPLGCRNCHHGEAHRNECTRCHEAERLPDTVVVRFNVVAAGHAPRERSVGFPHRRHTDLPCTACHGEDRDRTPVDSAASCRGCHDQHHDAGRACAVCHRTSATLASHAAPARPHVACNACHATTVIARLSPTRTLCLACHGVDVDHNPGRECTVCHMQAPPEVYRGRLLGEIGP